MTAVVTVPRHWTTDDDFEVRQAAWSIRQARARRAPTAGIYPGAGRGRYGTDLGGDSHSKHAFGRYMAGRIVWFSHTKPRTSVDARRRARKAQRAARRVNR